MSCRRPLSTATEAKRDCLLFRGRGDLALEVAMAAAGNIQVAMYLQSNAIRSGSACVNGVSLASGATCARSSFGQSKYVTTSFCIIDRVTCPIPQARVGEKLPTSAIARADVAAFMLDALQNDSYLRKTVGISWASA
jgi:hypothetical protein